jgi:hypothetical protein
MHQSHIDTSLHPVGPGVGSSAISTTQAGSNAGAITRPDWL